MKIPRGSFFNLWYSTDNAPEFNIHVPISIDK